MSTNIDNNGNGQRMLLASVALNVGLLCILCGALMPILRMPMATARWIYAAGAVLAIAGRFASPRPEGEVPLRVRRLLRLETWSTVFFAVGAFFMFYPAAGATDWVAFTLAGGFLQAYTSIMISRVMRKK